MKNIYPFLTITIGLILSICYFLYVKNKIEDKAWDVATNYVTTILSIVIGAMISIVIYNYQKQNENDQKLNELRLNLVAELSDINRVLNSREVITVNNLSFLVTYIEPIIIVECAKSGLFSSLDVENFLHISRKIKLYNVQVDYFLSLLAHSNNQLLPLMLTNCNRNMETSRLAIIQDIDKIKLKLNISLSDSINSL